MLFVSISAYAEEYPAGLRLPTKKELSKEPLRKKSSTKNAKVEGDFNGDGKLDYAFLLASVNSSKGALAVKLSKDNGYEWKIVDKTLDWNGEPMGIDLAKPDKYETACGKGYWECGGGEPATITLKNAGFWYSPFEKGGAVMIFWDDDKNDFQQIIMSD